MKQAAWWWMSWADDDTCFGVVVSGPAGSAVAARVLVARLGIAPERGQCVAWKMPSELAAVVPVADRNRLLTAEQAKALDGSFAGVAFCADVEHCTHDILDGDDYAAHAFQTVR